MAICLRPSLLGLTLLSGTFLLHADTIASVTGPINSGIELFSTEVLGVSWTQTSDYSDVTISAVLNGETAITAYLTTQIGPGTTTSDEIAEATVTPTASGASFSLLPLLSLADLGEGTYYLTLLDSSPASMADGWAQTTAAVQTTAPGAVLNSYYDSVTASGYAPANPFFLTFFTPSTQQSLLFDITGIAVPEPRAVALISLSIVGVCAVRRRYSGIPRRS